MEFANAVHEEENYTLTENQAVALKSTGNPLLDLFSKVGAIRAKDSGEVSGMFQAALSEDKLLATKVMFYARNIRGGLGERNTFRKMLLSLAKSNPEIVIKNISLIPFFGRYDDLYVLIDTKAEKAMWNYIVITLAHDIAKMKKGEPVSLCAKWLKSINTSSEYSVGLGKLTAKNLGMSEREYRKLLSGLRSYIQLTEKKMSANKWDDIEYSSVPSRAMKNYRKTFKKHDEKGFAEYIENVTTGKEKINAFTLYPCDILISANLRHNQNYYGYPVRQNYFRIDNDLVLEAQWKALPDYVKGECNVLVMADTSSSMEGLPMATSIGLAIYFAERNKGAYKNLFMTFSCSPEFVFLKGNTLAEKVSCIKGIVENTNLEAGLELILDVAKKNNISQDEMPKSLVVISDMQFDAATNNFRNSLYERNFKTSKKQTFHKSMEQMFSDAGYTLPTIIYWNVSERSSAIQVKADDQNVMLVSGQATSTFKSVLGNIGRNPYEFMVETLSDPQYDVVRI